MSKASAGKQAQKHFDWIAKIFNTDKTERYKELFVWPHPVVEECERAFQDLEKVNDGINPVFDLVFTNPESRDDGSEYLKEIGGYSQIKKQGFKKMWTSPNSLYVVDMPAEQLGRRPDPYYYYLGIEHLFDFDIDENCELLYVIFPQDFGFVVIDDGFYHRFEVDGNDWSNYKSYDPVSHDFGFTPCRFAWPDYISDKKQWLKKNPASNQLGNLDWLLLFSMMERHTDLTAGLPINWFYQADKDEDEKNERDRENGVLDDSHYILDRTSSYTRNPNKHPFTGAATTINVPEPDNDPDGQPNLVPPGGYIERDIEAVTYVKDKAQYLREVFRQSVSGYSGEAKNDQAKNEKQIGSIYETRKTIINNLARSFEASEKWLISTIMKARFPESFIDVHISRGTEYYLEDAGTVLQRLKEATEQQLPVIIESTETQYFQTKFRHNNEMLQRVDILRNLEPFRYTKRDVIQNLYSTGKISFQEYMFKTDFISLVAQFERENGPLTEFGTAIEVEDGQDPFSVRIERIKEIIFSYIKEPETAAPQTD